MSLGGVPGMGAITFPTDSSSGSGDIPVSINGTNLMSLEDFIVWVESRKAIKDPEATKWSDGVKKIGGYKFCDYEFC